MGNLTKLTNLSIGSNKFRGYLPEELCKLSKLKSLDISKCIGEQLSLVSAAPNHLLTLALSVNGLSGKFPAFICNLTSLLILVLSKNNFSGELPQCLGNLTGLKELDLMNNNFSGDIPVSLGSLGNLRYLKLHNNEFQGKLPLSFHNLRELDILDVGKNNLRDIFPPWIGVHLLDLQTLILRSNTFYGKIPAQICHLSLIQVLNLAHNQFTENIPPCVSNFSALTGYHAIQYPGFFSIYDEMIIGHDSNGNELEYTSMLWLFFSINLSNNNISGEIPDGLMDLRGLVNLNLAGNHLAGRIPDKIGKLRKLQILDLSRNDLCGPIPQSLSDLNFLSSLNLSFNHLSGRIPTGNQLRTLIDPSIYAGNNQLCGQPVTMPCVHNYNQADSDSDDVCTWVYAGIGPGLLVGFLVFCSCLHFIKSWRYSYFHFVEEVFDKIVNVNALMRRKFYI